MFKVILYIAKFAVVLGIAYWLAQQPGSVSAEWQGYRIETSPGMLVLAGLLLAFIAAIFYQIYRAIMGAPRAIGQARKESRSKRGYKALSNGMLALAAGDAQEAQRWSRKASGLLQDPPLTLLLSAQTAQLTGDERAAKRYFESMLESEDTRFMGLRGLLMQAMKEGDEESARSYLEQARQIRPNSAWVSEALFELSEKVGDLAAAERALLEAKRFKLLPKEELARKTAIVALQRAEVAEAQGESDLAFTQAKQAHKQSPSLVPAGLLLAKQQQARGQTRQAEKTLRKTWAERAHPDLAEAYLSLRPSDADLKRFKALQSLIGDDAGEEGLFALAKAALQAELWGEARRYLGTLEKAGQLDARACLLGAKLEQREHGDARAAATWMDKLEAAQPDPAWVCDSCGTQDSAWEAHCPSCKTFDGLRWRRPEVVEAAKHTALPAGVGHALDAGSGAGAGQNLTATDSSSSKGTALSNSSSSSLVSEAKS